MPLALIQQVQEETPSGLHRDALHRRTVGTRRRIDNHRLRVPCEVLTYELTGIRPEDADDRASPDPRDNRYFTLDELRAFPAQPGASDRGERPCRTFAYHQLPNGTTPEKRLVEHARTLFFMPTISSIPCHSANTGAWACPMKPTSWR